MVLSIVSIVMLHATTWSLVLVSYTFGWSTCGVYTKLDFSEEV